MCLICLFDMGKLVGQDCFHVPPKQNQNFYFYFNFEWQIKDYCTMTIQATYLYLGENRSALFGVTDYSTIHTTYLCVSYFPQIFVCFIFSLFSFFYELWVSFVCLTWAKLVGQDCFLVPPKQNQNFYFYFSWIRRSSFSYVSVIVSLGLLPYLKGIN